MTQQQRKFRNKEERVAIVQGMLSNLAALKDAVHTDPVRTKQFEESLVAFVGSATGRCFEGSFELDVPGQRRLKVVKYVLQGRRVLKCDLRADDGEPKKLAPAPPSPPVRSHIL